MSRLIFDPDPWFKDFDRCPADQHFSAWLDRIPDELRVFHMGTGMHHTVGVDAPARHRVWGMTANQAELDEYMAMVVGNAELALRYQVVFGDVHQFNPLDWFPRLDAVALFHIGEFDDDRRGVYGGLPAEEVIYRFLLALRPMGYMAFYTGSVAYDRIRPVVDQLVEDARLMEWEYAESIRILRKIMPRD